MNTEASDGGRVNFYHAVVGYLYLRYQLVAASKQKIYDLSQQTLNKNYP